MSDYEEEARDILTREMSPVPVIRGIEKKERILAFWNVANEIDAPERIKEHIKYRMQAIKESEG